MPTDEHSRLPSPADSRFETLFENAPFSVQMLAPSGRTLRVNRAWEARWDPARVAGFKRFVLDEYNILEDPQLEAKGVTPLLREAFAGRAVELPTIQYDPGGVGKPGKPRWMRAFAHPVRDAAGAVAEVMLIHEDVTARVESEQALRGSELRLKQLANTIPQLAWMADAEGSIHWYNERWYDYTGTSPDAMQGWGWQSVHDPELLPAVVERWKQSLAAGEPFEMTFPLRGRDGRFRPFLTLVAPLKDEAGRVVQWFGTNTDVSALQEAERNARRAEERLLLAVRAGHIGIWDWEIANNVVEWSDEVYALHGVAPGAFGGTAQDFAALVHPDDREALWQRIEAAVAAGDGFTADFRIRLPDGRDRWLSTWARVQRDAHGAPHRMIGATISIDDYKRAEAALREGDRLKDEFLAMLAHELRNPLAPIGSSAHLLKRIVGDERGAGQAVDIILRQVAHMTELVDDLLDVSRVTRGVIRLDAAVVELSAIVDSAIEQVRPLIESRGHALQVGAAGRPLHASGDATRLTQALTNLLTNAAKYTPVGGRIAVRVEAAGERARIEVEDNGVGIDPDFLPHAFDLFTQSARTPDRSIGGLGIGLALARRIVELHDGTLTARSAGLGHGCTFVVELPLVEAPEARAEAVAPPAGLRRPLRIVVVDDNVDAAEALGALLDIEGHAVTIVHAAAAALDVAPGEPVDVFMLDIGLPGMDGYELARRLRPAHRQAAFIALTGYGQAEDIDRAKAAGFDHHFLKPVDLDALDRVLAALGEGDAPQRRPLVEPAAGS